MLVQELAAWAMDVYERGAIPDAVTASARSQRLSVFGALAATEAVGRAAPISETGGAIETIDDQLHRAVDRAAALDFDDYICFGHAGLSSVLTPAVVAAHPSVRVEHDQVVRAQVVANELHARVAGACLLGPHGPTQWAYAHALSAAAAAGLLLGLDEKALGHALAIALAQPAVPTRAAFFGPDTRSLTPANGAALGLRAARMAGEGRTGPLNILSDMEGGLFPTLIRRALPEMMSGLGTGWALRTLSVKTTPSCSYVDPVLDALQSLMPLAAEDIATVEVAAALPTLIMAKLSRRYLSEAGLTPSVAAFSVPLSAALLIQHGELSPAQLAPEPFARDERAVLSLADRIRVRHSPRLTKAMLSSLAGPFPVHRMLAGRLLRRAGRAAQPWSPEALDAFRMAFPVRVKVLLHNGRTLHASADVPQGAAGSAELSPEDAATAKFRLWAERAWGTGPAERLHDALSKAAHSSWSLLNDRAQLPTAGETAARYRQRPEPSHTPR